MKSIQIKHTWRLTTRSNLDGYIEEDTEIFIDKTLAEETCAEANKKGWGNRKDWVVQNLADAIQQSLDSAVYNAGFTDDI